MTIAAWLKSAANILADNLFETPLLDAEIILAHTIGHPRTWLHAHNDETLNLRHQEIADARLDLRLDRVPIAYIIGHKEFYGRRFGVTTATLIPRPESEQMIELLNEIVSKTAEIPGTITSKLVDIGTGSGCLGITAKLEHPELDVTLLDTSKPAIAVAEKNARALGAEVATLQSDLLDNYPFAPNIVLANLPYVGRDWEISESVRHEPNNALFANDNGVALIKTCLEQLAVRLESGSIAIFEADPRQWDDIIAHAKYLSFNVKARREFATSFVKN